jgi:hypothetical protein
VLLGPLLVAGLFYILSLVILLASLVGLVIVVSLGYLVVLFLTVLA